MDTFPIKRGIGLSRTPHPGPQFAFPTREPIPYTHNYPVRTAPTPQITSIFRIPQQTVDQQSFKPPNNHARTFSVVVPSQSQPPKETLNQISFQQGSFQQTQLAQPQLRFAHPPNFQETQQTSLMMQRVGGSQVSEQASKSIQLGIDRRSTSVSESNGSTILQAQQSPISPTKIIGLSSNAQRCENLQPRLRPVSEAPEMSILAAPVDQNLQIKQLKQQKLELQQQLKRLLSKQESWLHVRQGLLKQLEQKTLSFAQFQRKSALSIQEYQKKTVALQSELRLMKGNRTRLQIQIDSNKKLFKSQRDKNEKARQQMTKMIFFQDDLIHAKDYMRLKDQLDYVLCQNGKLYAEHQQFIVEVGENRRVAEEKITELGTEVSKLKEQLKTLKVKLEQVRIYDQDKLCLIKLQNQLNFTRKKCEQQVELLRNKDTQLESALNQINHFNKNANRSFDEITFNQVKDTVSLYEARINDLSNNLLRSQAEVEKQRKKAQLLTSQLRRTRQDRSISSLRQKSNENNLKNEVEMLQKNYFCDSEVKNKRINNLEEALQRKVKEIASRDYFIKDFLLTKIKHLPSNDAESLLQVIYQYFNPEKTPESTIQDNHNI